MPEFSSLLSQIRKLLPTADLDKNDHEIVEHNLNSIEQEATRLKPRLLLIESSLKSLESIVGSTENLGATSIKLMPLLTQAIDIARQLFP